MITTELIHRISSTANPVIVAGLVQYLPAALTKYEINTDIRVENFLAQIAEESAGFRTLREYGSGREYEGREDLGNTHPGDGERFLGRGLIMLTGRYNYQTYGEKLGIDLVDNPAQAEEPRVAALTACLFWSLHGLNAYADRDDIVGITRRINGGENGLSTRELYRSHARAAIAAQRKA